MSSYVSSKVHLCHAYAKPQESCTHNPRPATPPHSEPGAAGLKLRSLPSQLQAAQHSSAGVHLLHHAAAFHGSGRDIALHTESPPSFPMVKASPAPLRLCTTSPYRFDIGDDGCSMRSQSATSEKYRGEEHCAVTVYISFPRPPLTLATKSVQSEDREVDP